MNRSASRWAASVAVALLAVVPGGSRAENHPTRPAEPSFEVVFDSDPWRPDVYPPERAAGQPVSVSASGLDDARAARQPAAKNERWLRLLLRFFVGLWTGGAR